MKNLEKIATKGSRNEKRSVYLLYNFPENKIGDRFSISTVMLAGISLCLDTVV